MSGPPARAGLNVARYMTMSYKKDREVDEEEDDEDGNVFEKEKDYENVIDQYYERGYVHNPVMVG